MATLIQHGEVITALDRYHADVRIEDGVITAIGKSLPVLPGDTVIDATGHYVIPGGIDAHTHMELPFMGTLSADDFETGTRAAAIGGTTGIIDFVIPTKEMTLLEGLQMWREKAEGKTCIDYSFHMSLVNWNETISRQMEECMDLGMTSFKTFMAYKGSIGIDDGQLFMALKRARELGALVTTHAVNGDVITALANEFAAAGHTAPRYHALTQPDIIEGEAAHRAIALARLADQGLYIVHVSCAEAMNEVRDARFRGQSVFGEVLIQHLLLTDEEYERQGFEGAKYVMSPPLRGRNNHDPLWQALQNGWLQTVATDHCPFNYLGQRDMGKDDFRKIPNGMPGVEDRLNLLHHFGVRTGRLTVNQWVEVVATAPAKIFGMYPKKGSISIGADADLVIYNPNHTHTLSQKNQAQNLDYHAYEGWEITGKPRDVLVRGKVIVKDGTFVGEKGFGQFVQRAPFKPQARRQA